MPDQKTLRLLLYLATPGNKATATPELDLHNTGFLKSVVKLSRSNGLLLCVANRLEELGIKSPFITDIKLKEEAKQKGYIKTLHLLNQIEKNHGLRYIVIKLCSSVPHVPRDIDIFLSPADKPKFSRLLIENGMKVVYDSVAESSYAGNGHMELDIYTSIIYANKRFFDEDFLWNARVREQKWGTEYDSLQPYANYPLILIHSLFGHRVVSLLDFLHLQFLRSSTDLTPGREYAYRMGWGEVFDIAEEQLEKMQRQLNTESKSMSFPYLFETDFVMKCFSMLQGADQTTPFKPTISLRLSLLIDKVVHELRKSPFYEPLEKLKFPGRIATNLGLIVRRLRGDRKA